MDRKVLCQELYEGYWADCDQECNKEEIDKAWEGETEKEKDREVEDAKNHQTISIMCVSVCVFVFVYVCVWVFVYCMYLYCEPRDLSYIPNQSLEI